MDMLIFLTSVTIVLLAGIISIYLSKKTKLPSSLLFFIVGVLIGSWMHAGRPVVQLGGNFLAGLSVVALLVVIFESTSKLKFSTFDSSTYDALHLFFLSLLLNVAVLVTISHYLSIPVFAALLFSFLITTIEFNSVFSRSHLPRNKVTELLQDESLLSNAVALVIPFLLISFVQLPHPTLISKILGFAIPAFAGVGIAIICSLLLFKALHVRSLEKISLLVTFFAIIVSYLVAQQIDGNGIVAVASVGLIFANVFVKQKSLIKSHVDLLYSILEAVLFIVVGVVVGFPLNATFLLNASLLFLLLVTIRFIAALITLRNFDVREKLEVALCVPKGLATITVAFFLLNYAFTGSSLLVQYLVTFFVLSSVFDTLLDKIGVYSHR